MSPFTVSSLTRSFDDLVNRLVLTPPAMRVAARFIYPMYTRMLGGDDRVQFFNFGYEEDPPMGLPLSEEEEPDRYSIQLYHGTAIQADIGGARVLEASCGHGGGAAYLVRALKVRAYTGLDLNKNGIEFCRRRHHEPGLSFVHGNAEQLPFAAGDFDAVLSIEASHHYADFPGFLAEVARVLVPQGHFLYADMRPRAWVQRWEADLRAAPLRQVSARDISPDVLRGIRHNGTQVVGYVQEHLPDVPFAREIAGAVAARPFAEAEQKLSSGEYTYRMYHFIKD